MSKYIGHITEETWPEARAILDAFRVVWWVGGQGYDEDVL